MFTIEPEKRASVLKNYLYNLSYQILLLIVPLITMPHLARTLGIDQQGTFSVLHAISSVFVMLGCVGLNIYGQREIAYYKNTPQKCNRVFWEIELIRLLTLSVSLIVYVAFIWFNFNVKSIINVYQPIYFSLFGLEIIAAMLDISWFYQGLENFKFQTIRNFAVKLLSLALILIFVRTEKDLWLYIVIFTCSNIAGNASLWFDRFKNGRFFPPRRRSFLRHLGRSFIMFLPQIATTVYAQLDKVMIGGLVNDQNLQAGIYDNAEKIVKISLTVVTSIGLVMLSRVANTYMKKDKKKTLDYIRSSYKLYMCLAVPIMFGIAGIAEKFIPRFFSEVENSDHIIPVILALCPIILFIGGSNVFGTQFLLPTNRMKPYIMSVFTGMVVNVIFNLILIPKMGAMGAAIATSLAELSVLIVQVVSVRRDFGLKMMLSGWRNIVAGAIMFVCVYSLGKLLSDTITSIILQVVVGMSVYGIILILLRDKFVLKYLKLVLNKLNKGVM